MKLPNPMQGSNVKATLRTGVVMGSMLLLVVVSAIAVAHSVHKWRLYLNELQALDSEHMHLQTEWGQLLLEQHTWGAYSRVGRIATEQLNMRNPAPTEIIMVRQ